MPPKIYGYSHQSIDDSDVAAVAATLKSDYLTTGPQVRAFEKALAGYVGARFCVAVSSATAGLHLGALALGLGPGDEAITTPITFLASANCARYCGATVRFGDIDPETANLDPDTVAPLINERTKVLIPVHFAGQSCDMERFADLARAHGLKIMEDAAHALGSSYKGQKVGCCAFSDLCVFSFHPVKNITTCEGGAVTTNSPELYEKLLALRGHGMHHEVPGETLEPWEYRMEELGFNYRLNDVQAALGLSQLKRLDTFRQRRRAIVAFYNEHLGWPHLIERDFSEACFHLYPVRVEKRAAFYHKAREMGLNLQVHYIPVPTQPYYQRLGAVCGAAAADYYAHCISLPLYPDLTDADLEEIVRRLQKVRDIL